ncbi:hypothetical protein F2P81_024474 [Scophthalmus maximus]|uniref:Uncharacterized protein n=1 Tax=Scophthalmus maximus TaxID=52904 RepID=A0A6A4RZT1_SCOMX|nr:hypothetical protein F2P81_024474 [Scophthalmus maximus]
MGLASLKAFLFHRVTDEEMDLFPSSEKMEDVSGKIKPAVLVLKSSSPTSKTHQRGDSGCSVYTDVRTKEKTNVDPVGIGGGADPEELMVRDEKYTTLNSWY